MLHRPRTGFAPAHAPSGSWARPPVAVLLASSVAIRGFPGNRIGGPRHASQHPRSTRTRTAARRLHGAAAAGHGRGHRAGTVRRLRRTASRHRQPRAGRATLLRSGPAHGLRFQPRGRRAFLRRSRAARSRLRDVPVGTGAGAGPEHQPADGPGPSEGRHRTGATRGRAGRERDTRGSRIDPRTAAALRQSRAGRSQAARPGLRGSDGKGRARLPPATTTRQPCTPKP